MTTLDLTFGIDRKNHRFSSAVSARLKLLRRFNDQSLEWLMVEHYQFSSVNTSFLNRAASTAGQLRDSRIRAELLRNYEEERDHSTLYKSALRAIGTDVDCRVEFPPTAYFFHKIAGLLEPDPSVMLGAIYATETAAIFEHEVFWSISRELSERRKFQWDGTALKRFHDMHLDGVEQSHKDGLGIFLSELGMHPVAETGIRPDEVKEGAHRAIVAMATWWDDLLSRVERPLLVARLPASAFAS